MKCDKVPEEVLQLMKGEHEKRVKGEHTAQHAANAQKQALERQPPTKQQT